MNLSILIEPIDGKGYRASGAEPFAISAEGTTREEALAKLQQRIQDRLKTGAEIVTVQVVSKPHPWMEFAGMFKDDPMLDEWKHAMAEYRQKVEEDTDYP